MDPASERLAGIAFGRFQVLPDRRDVLADGRPIKLGGRAFDVLMALVEARGAVVGKEALMARVWQGRAIEENSLAADVVARIGCGCRPGLDRCRLEPRKQPETLQCRSNTTPSTVIISQNRAIGSRTGRNMTRHCDGEVV